MTKEIRFKAYIEGYKNAFAMECKEQVDLDVDFKLDYEKLGIIALTEKGSKFIKFISEVLFMPKVRVQSGVPFDGKDGASKAADSAGH